MAGQREHNRVGTEGYSRGGVGGVTGRAQRGRAAGGYSTGVAERNSRGTHLGGTAEGHTR